MRSAGDGRVESVNTGAARPDPWTRAAGGLSGIDKRPVDGPVRLEVDGVVGDAVCDTTYHGGPDQAVYAYAAEDLAFWSAELGQEVGPGGVGENLTLAGVDCTHAVVGERWAVGGAVLVVRSARTPCRVFAGFRGVPDLVRRFAAAGRPGCYLSVEQPGAVCAGDALRVLSRPAHGVTVADLAAVLTDRGLVDRVAHARDDLGVRARQRLDRVLATRRA